MCDFIVRAIRFEMLVYLFILDVLLLDYPEYPMVWCASSGPIEFEIWLATGCTQ